MAPVATTIPARKSGSVEQVTALLCDGLLERGHQVSLFGVAETRTRAELHAVFDQGYLQDPHGMWPWEMCELLNVAAACERHEQFDVIHYQGAYFPMSIAFSRVVPVPIVQTLHHQPIASELALLGKYPDAHYVALSAFQARSLCELRSVTTIPHGLDIQRFPAVTSTASGDCDDCLVYLGRCTPGKGPLQAIEAARRFGMRLQMAAPMSDYFRSAVAPHVDGDQVQYLGELDFTAKTQLLSRARALLYPVQEGEPFGLALAEAMACGTPVAALRRGAVPELVLDGVSGYAFETLDALIEGLPSVIALDRAAVRKHAQQHFDADAMVAAHERLYSSVVHAGSSTQLGDMDKRA